MNVSLTPELEEFVAAKVKTGLYNSASEVVQQSLRLLHERDRIQNMRTKELRRELRNAEEQIVKGERFSEEDQTHLGLIADERKKRIADQ